MPNTAQKQCRGVSKGYTIKFLLAENKCYAFIYIFVRHCFCARPLVATGLRLRLHGFPTKLYGGELRNPKLNLSRRRESHSQKSLFYLYNQVLLGQALWLLCVGQRKDNSARLNKLTISNHRLYRLTPSPSVDSLISRAT